MNMDMRKVTIAIVVILLATGVAFAQSQQSSKAAAQAGAISVLSPDESSGVDSFVTIMSGSVKTSQQKDLFLGVSLECGLYTRTLSKSKGGNKDTSMAEAGVRVRVLIDGVEAAPGEVTFCRRSQELSATFQGLIDGCLSVDDLGNVILDEECLLPEEIELVLDTMSANTFNFLHADAGVGTHFVEVQAMIDLGTDAQAGDAEARATLGKGSLTIEEVRLIKGAEVEL
jgi:hypothetical protein